MAQVLANFGRWANVICGVGRMSRIWERAFPQTHTSSHRFVAIKIFSKHNMREIPTPRETDISFEPVIPVASPGSR